MFTNIIVKSIKRMIRVASSLINKVAEYLPKSANYTLKPGWGPFAARSLALLACKGVTYKLSQHAKENVPLDLMRINQSKLKEEKDYLDSLLIRQDMCMAVSVISGVAANKSWQIMPEELPKIFDSAMNVSMKYALKVSLTQQLSQL